YIVDVGRLMQQDGTANNRFLAEAERAAEFVEKTAAVSNLLRGLSLGAANLGLPDAVMTSDKPTGSAHADWFRALGGYRYWAAIDNASSDSCGNFQMTFTYFIRDNYDW